MNAFSVICSDYKLGADTDFERKMQSLARDFARVRGLAPEQVEAVSATYTGGQLPTLDYSISSLSNVDKVYESLPDQTLQFVSVMSVVNYPPELKPLLASIAYFGEVIRRHSRRKMHWADFNVFSSDYAFQAWGEASLPPSINLATANRDRVFAVADLILERSSKGWSSIAGEINKHENIDRFLESYQGKFLYEEIGSEERENG